MADSHQVVKAAYRGYETGANAAQASSVKELMPALEPEPTPKSDTVSVIEVLTPEGFANFQIRPRP